MSDTNAIKWLRAQRVGFDVLEYAFTQVGADRAAEAVGRPLEATCKTLTSRRRGVSSGWRSCPATSGLTRAKWPLPLV